MPLIIMFQRVNYIELGILKEITKKVVFCKLSAKGTFIFSGQTGGGDLLRGGWTVLDVLFVIGVFGGAESKKRKKFWIPPPQGADLAN